MDFYDTMTPEELQQYMQMQGRIRNEERNKDFPLRQPLAPGLPRVYDLRGGPSSWQLPSPPPSPPPDHHQSQPRRRRRRSHHQSQPRRRLGRRVAPCAAPFGSPERPRAWTVLRGRGRVHAGV